MLKYPKLVKRSIMLERTLKRALQRISKTFPVLLLTGQRQIGKSVLLKMLKEKKTALCESG